MRLLDIPRMAVKLYAAPATLVEPARLVEAFHRWIQRDTLPHHLPLDVADYSHVHRGPGVLLACHAGTFTFDDADGRPGLRYRRRRAAFDAAPLPDALRSLATACAALQAEDVCGGLRFPGHELLLQIHDRLRAPRAPRTLATVRTELEATAAELFGGGAALRVEPAGEDGEPFAARVLIEGGAGPPRWGAPRLS